MPAPGSKPRSTGASTFVASDHHRTCTAATGQATAHPNPLRRTIMPSLFNIKLEEIEYGLDHGTFSSAQLVKAYLTRIEETNDTFCAVIETNPDALTIAQRLDAEMECSGRRGCVLMLS
jgi:hypothetical protein